MCIRDRSTPPVRFLIRPPGRPKYPPVRFLATGQVRTADRTIFVRSSYDYRTISYEFYNGLEAYRGRTVRNADRTIFVRLSYDIVRLSYELEACRGWTFNTADRTIFVRFSYDIVRLSYGMTGSGSAQIYTWDYV